MELHNQDVITITALGGRVVEGLGTPPHRVDAADDVLFYLGSNDVQSGTAEEIGMILKHPMEVLEPAIEKLEKGGYVKVRHVDVAGMERERIRRMKMTSEERDREDAQQDSLWKHKHGPAGSYRGGMPPHEYLEQEVEFEGHATIEPCEEED
jgi:hypothetical protein